MCPLKRITLLSFVFIASINISLALERAPVFFVHGLLVPNSVYTEIVPLKEIFEENGYTLYVAERDSDGVMEDRADQLKAEIDKYAPEGPYHLLGHSAGGLDSRLMLFKYPEMAERCLSLTTMASPHRGSPIATETLKNVDSGIPTPENLLYMYLFKSKPNGRQVVYEVTPEHMAIFNERVKNDPNVRYFSMAWYIEQPYFIYTRPYIWKNHSTLNRLGFNNNDGTVPVESAKWGEHIGTFPGDHLSETSPIPYNNKKIYEDNFKFVMQNLDKEFL